MARYKDKKQYRYKNYDYSQDGFYFVTVCTKGKGKFFGEVKNEKIELSDIGLMADKFWREIPVHFPFCILDEYVVMPNHVHGIIQIDKDFLTDNVGTQNLAFNSMNNNRTQNLAFLREEYENKFEPQSKNLSSIIRGYKIGVTKYVRTKKIDSVWQPRFYDRIIRSENELNRIRQYIINNPLKWELERNNPENIFM